MKRSEVAVIGAGPAGLTSAYLLGKENVSVTVLESDPTYVGGISRTVRYKGYHFDIGGHRFFSKSKEVEDLWTELLPDDMLVRPRSSRIYYNGNYFSYPLKAGDALKKLGPVEATRCVMSYLKAQALPIREPRNFQDWVTNQFGSRLFEIFFKTYTEKVWGMPCTEISADWAAQRIKGLSLKSAILNAFRNPEPAPTNGDRTNVIKSLIGTFRYPRKGPGMMWEACAEKVRGHGNEVHMGRRVVGLDWDDRHQLWTITHEDTQTREWEQFQARHVISSAPIRHLAQGIQPSLGGTAIAAADSLKYRDFLTVALILKDRGQFDDNWIYIHDPSVQVGRVQNFKSWSPEMVPDPSMNCYGLEYFCFEKGGLWKTSDGALIELAKQELQKIGLANIEDVTDGCVVRQAKAYPVYDDHYADHVLAVRDELEARFPTLHLIGRNGMHKYNNQDHAMMTAMLAVKNIVAGERVYDLWTVNQDAEYHEAGNAAEKRELGATGERLVPRRVREMVKV